MPGLLQAVPPLRRSSCSERAVMGAEHSEEVIDHSCDHHPGTDVTVDVTDVTVDVIDVTVHEADVTVDVPLDVAAVPPDSTLDDGASPTGRPQGAPVTTNN